MEHLLESGKFFVSSLSTSILNPREDLSVYGLAIYVVLGFVVFVLFKKKEGRACSFWGYLFPKATYANASTRMDLKIYFLSKFVSVFLLAGVLSIDAPMSITQAFSSFLASGHELTQPSLGWTVLYVGAVLVTFDICWTFIHYLYHRVPALWEFHKVHHIARTMTPLTKSRVHPFEDFCIVAIVTIGMASITIAFQNLSGQNVNLGIREVVGTIALIKIFGNFRHSHIWISYGKLDKLLISPAMHQIHHSRAPRHVDKNFSFFFTFPDRILGTLYVPESEEEIEFGCRGEDDSEWNATMLVPLLRPIGKLFSAGASRSTRM